MTRPEALPTTSVLAVAFLLAGCGDPAPKEETVDPRLIIDETAFFDNRLNGLWRYEDGSASDDNLSPASALYAVASRKGTEIVMLLPDADDKDEAISGMMLSFRPRPLTSGEAVYTRLNSPILAPANRLPESNEGVSEDLNDVFLRYRFAGDGILEIWSLDTDDLQEIFNPVSPCGADAAAKNDAGWRELPLEELFKRRECWPKDGGGFEFAGRFVRD